MAGFFAAERSVGDEDEVAVGGDLVDDQIVFGAAVAGVEEAACGIDEDFAGAVGGDVSAGEEGRDAGEEFEGSGGGVPAHLGDGGVEFVDGVGPLAVGVEGEVARASSGERGEVGGGVGDDLGDEGVKLVDHDAVGAEVVDEDEFVVGREADAVGVGAGLTGGFGAVTIELDLSDGVAEAAVEADLTGEDFAGAVADGDEDAAGVVDGGVDHVEVGDGEGVDEFEVAGGLNGEGAECSGGFAGGAAGEEETSGTVGAEGEEVWGDHWGGYAEIGEGSGGVPAGYVDAIAGFGGGGADVDEGVFGGGRGGEFCGSEGGGGRGYEGSAGPGSGHVFSGIHSSARYFGRMLVVALAVFQLIDDGV